MNPSLAQFLSARSPAASETCAWGALRFRLESYLCTEEPPSALVTSVRAVVVHDDSVLVVRDPVSTHILPGGRREPGETYEATLRRELLEETGWTIATPSLLGFKHFHHLSPQPDGYPYPYPDFLQLIFSARAQDHRPDTREPDGYELASWLAYIAEVTALPLTPSERVFFSAVMQIQRLGE